jgi:hypothetical protein
MKTPEPVIYTYLSPRRSSLIIPPSQSEEPISSKDMKTSEPVTYPYVSPHHSSRIILSSQSEQPINVVDYDGYDSSPSIDSDERIANIRNERRYRLLLTHDYHPSRMSI